MPSKPLNANTNIVNSTAHGRRFVALARRADGLPWGAGVLHLAAGAALFAFLLTLPGCSVEAEQAAADVRPVKAEVVKFDSQSASVMYPGTIQPRHEGDIAFQVSGRVAKRFVDIGTEVAPGMVLAVLDDEDLKLALRAVEAQLTSARADAAQAKIDLERYEQIKNSPAFSRSVYDKRVSTKQMADARAHEAESQLRLKQNQLAYATIKADQFGVVTAITVEASQVVAAGQTVLTIARAGDLEVVVDIPEQRLPDLKDGRATVTVWSQPGEKLEAHLREVAASADPVTRTYAARYVLDELPADLQIGMSATLTISNPSGSGASVAEVPLSAIFQDREMPTVWVVDGEGKLIRTPVTVSGFRTATALISGGVKDGDIIVTAGAHRLDESQRVRVMSTDITQPAI